MTASTIRFSAHDDLRKSNGPPRIQLEPLPQYHLLGSGECICDFWRLPSGLIFILRDVFISPSDLCLDFSPVSGDEVAFGFPLPGVWRWPLRSLAGDGMPGSRRPVLRGSRSRVRR